MGHLDLSDICSMSQSCKGFLEMSCGVSRLCCPFFPSSHPVEAYAALREFLLRRCDQGMEVKLICRTFSCSEACSLSLLRPMFCSNPVKAVMCCASLRSCTSLGTPVRRVRRQAPWCACSTSCNKR